MFVELLWMYFFYCLATNYTDMNNMHITTAKYLETILPDYIAGNSTSLHWPSSPSKEGTKQLQESQVGSETITTRSCHLSDVYIWLSNASIDIQIF